MAGIVPAFLAAGGDQLIGKEEGPFRFDPFEGGQFLPFVMQAADVFHHGLMAIAQKAFVAIAAAEISADAFAGALHQLGVFDGPGGVAHHRQAGAVGFLAGGFPGQQSLQGTPQAHQRSLGDLHQQAAIAMAAKEIEAVKRLQGGLGHADGAGIALGQAMVAFVAAFPDAVIGDAIGPSDVINEVLDEVRLVATAHHREATPSELRQLEKKERGGIQLQMAPAVVGHHRVAGAGVVFGVEGIKRVKGRLEPLHLVGLAHHGVEQAPHQRQHPLLEFPGPCCGVALEAAMRHRQTPNALDGVDAVAHPGVAVIAMHGVGCAGRQEAGDGMLPAQHHPFDRCVQALQQGFARLPLIEIGGNGLRQNHDLQVDQI